MALGVLTHESRRLAALKALQLLDTPSEERFDAIVRLAQRLFDVPMAAVTLIDEERQWFKASVGLNLASTPRQESFCDHTIRRPVPNVVPDATLDRRFEHNPFVTGDPRLRFYAGQPLRAPGGERVGVLCIMDQKPRELSHADVFLLRDLADWVETELASQSDLADVDAARRRLRPPGAPHLPGYDVAGGCVASGEVGGDFFDWYDTQDDTFQIVIAGVVGEGSAPAALVAEGVRAVLRGASRSNSLADAVDRTARNLGPDLFGTATLVTLFAARLDLATADVTYVDAGHGLAVILDADGGWRRLGAGGLPLGAGNLRLHAGGLRQGGGGLPSGSRGDALVVNHPLTPEIAAAAHAPCGAEQTVLAAGETLITVSEGFLKLFETPQDALAAALQGNRDSPTARDLVDLMTALCRDGDAHDDVTVVVLRRPT